MYKFLNSHPLPSGIWWAVERALLVLTQLGHLLNSILAATAVAAAAPSGMVNSGLSQLFYHLWNSEMNISLISAFRVFAFYSLIFFSISCNSSSWAAIMPGERETHIQRNYDLMCSSVP